MWNITITGKKNIAKNLNMNKYNNHCGYWTEGKELASWTLYKELYSVFLFSYTQRNYVVWLNTSHHDDWLNKNNIGDISFGIYLCLYLYHHFMLN